MSAIDLDKQPRLSPLHVHKIRIALPCSMLPCMELTIISRRRLAYVRV